MKNEIQELDDQRQALLAAKLGRFIDWRAPQLAPTIGPSDPSAFDAFEVVVQSVTETCTDRLRSYSDDEVRALAMSNAEGVSELQKSWDALATSDIRRLERREPPWFAGGFGHPDYQADFTYWAKMPHFSLAEITCLSVGIRPDSFSEDYLERLLKRRRDDLWAALRFLGDRYEQVTRQFSRTKPVPAAYFATWVVQFEIDIPEQLLDLLKRYHLAGVGYPVAEEEPKRESKREIDKIAQLLVVMAIDGYGYDPKAKRSGIPGEITNAAAEYGIGIHADTIRKYFRIGSNFISPDWKQDTD